MRRAIKCRNLSCLRPSSVMAAYGVFEHLTILCGTITPLGCIFSRMLSHGGAVMAACFPGRRWGKADSDQPLLTNLDL